MQVSAYVALNMCITCTNVVSSAIDAGHSMGGKTAMALSLRYPQMIERLVVVDVAPVSSSGMSDILKQIR